MLLACKIKNWVCAQASTHFERICYYSCCQLVCLIFVLVVLFSKQFNFLNQSIFLEPVYHFFDQFLFVTKIIINSSLPFPPQFPTPLSMPLALLLTFPLQYISYVPSNLSTTPSADYILTPLLFVFTSWGFQLMTGSLVLFHHLWAAHAIMTSYQN